MKSLYLVQLFEGSNPPEQRIVWARSEEEAKHIAVLDVPQFQKGRHPIRCFAALGNPEPEE